MRFVIEQLLRVLAPGCNACIHVQDLLAFKNQHGFMGRRDFVGAVVAMFEAGGFHRIGSVAIPKDPQQMAQRLNLHSLQFKTGYSRGSTNLAPAPNDYVLIFQKPGDPETPVLALHEPQKNSSGWITTEDWIKWAKGTWEDIQQVDVLDGWRSARESDEERHVCPLQLSLIRRLVLLYTNPRSIQPDVTVLDPFMGIGSTAFVCLGGPAHEGKIPPGQERNVIGFELKESYHDQSVRNVEKARAFASQGEGDRQKSLFDCGADPGADPETEAPIFSTEEPADYADNPDRYARLSVKTLAEDAAAFYESDNESSGGE